MSQPMGYYSQDQRGVRGWLARWWVNHRRKVIAEQLEKRRRQR